MTLFFLRGVSRADAGMYVCFVTNPRGGFNYRPAYLTVVPSKALANLFHKKELLLLQRKFPGTESLVNESPPVLILVICLSVRTNLTSSLNIITLQINSFESACSQVVVLGILIAIIACVVRRRTKEPLSPPDSSEV